MSSLSKLKDKARDFERKEDWARAVDAYLQIIQATEKGDSEAELSLFNRVGDLYLRLGRPSDAVDYYSRAADRYGEAGLYNNAIALCNKALRYQPDRLELYRKLGKLSAEQGFITDARRWYLEYAERLAKQGKTQDAFDALKEFAGLSEDPEIREMLAAQLEVRGETAETVNQLRLAYTQYVQQGVKPKIEELRARILKLDPRLDASDLTLTADGATGSRTQELPGIIDHMKAAPAAPPEPARGTIGVDEGFGFGEGGGAAGATATPPLPELDDQPSVADEEVATEELAGLMSTDMGVQPTEEILAADLPDLDIEQGADVADAEDIADPEAFELPTFEDEGAVAEEVDAAPLPELEAFETPGAEDEPEDDEADEDLGGDLPMLTDDLATDDEESAGALPMLDLAPDAEPAEAWADTASLDTADGADVEAAPAADEQMLDEVGAALDQGVLDGALADPGFETEAIPEDVAELEEEPVAQEVPEVEEAAVDAGLELDVDELIRSATERFEEGEEREALASLDAQHANLADANRLADAYRVAEALTRLDPDAVSAHQARVEYAFRLDDRPRLVEAYIDFANCLKRSGAEAKALSVFQRVLEIDPQNATARAALERPAKPAKAAKPKTPVADSDFIDLGGMLMDEDEHTTRFVVAETVESGDEERDFAEMLSQFRAKVAQHVPQEDTESHYDLGIAFKEMGLIDEAISEFQVSLRGGNERLKVYEELGQCFMKKDQYNIAAKLLARGAQLPASDDAELLGVYYLLGRCYEELGQTAEARESYERVLGLDIDFRDVNERLGQL